MPDAHIREDKLYLNRTADERRKLVHALNRVEGQVRGIRAMIEADRYCGDELHLLKAAISGLSRVARLLAEQHIDAANNMLVEGAPREIIGADLSRILKNILSI